LYVAAEKGHLSCLVLLLGLPGNYKMTHAEVNAPAETGHNKSVSHTGRIV